MPLLFVFTSGLIAVTVIAMLAEGVDKLLTAKVAGALLVASSFTLGGPVVDPQEQDAQPLTATVADINPLDGNAIRYQSTKEPDASQYLPDLPQYLPDPSEVASNDPSNFPGIDFTPTCGGRAGPGSRNRLDIAELNKGESEPRRC